MIKATCEEFKKYEDDKVEQRCAEMDDRLNKLKHGKAGRVLADIEAYDPEANSKLVKALQDLKDLKYPMMDQLERLKDAPMELIMASLHLESDTGEDAPQWIRDLRPSSSQLKIPVYPEVRDPKDPWSVKEEMLLEDAIAAKEVQGDLPHPWDWFCSPRHIRRYPCIRAYRSPGASDFVNGCRYLD
ncbi:hypothetical protein Tco_1228934 [Tanacetum coccineum]